MLVAGEKKSSIWVCLRSYWFMLHAAEDTEVLVNDIQTYQMEVERYSVFADHGYVRYTEMW